MTVNPKWLCILLAILIMAVIMWALMAMIKPEEIEVEDFSLRPEQIAEQDVMHIIPYSEISPGPEIILSQGD